MHCYTILNKKAQSEIFQVHMSIYICLHIYLCSFAVTQTVTHILSQLHLTRFSKHQVCVKLNHCNPFYRSYSDIN